LSKQKLIIGGSTRTPKAFTFQARKVLLAINIAKKMGKRNIKALLTRNAQNMKCAKNPFEQKTFDCQKSQ